MKIIEILRTAMFLFHIERQQLTYTVTIIVVKYLNTLFPEMIKYKIKHLTTFRWDWLVFSS